MIKIGLLGLGTVGSGVYEILSNKNKITKDIYIEKILVNNIAKKRKVDINKSILTTNPYEIINNDNIDIIIELIGGINPAYEYIKKALSSGKHVITANKAVIAKYMHELHDIAKNNNVKLMYEASVAGGIPIIKSIKQLMQINKIHSISGILNGTSNYILSSMGKETVDFDVVLKKAQDLGYAESDPTDDIDGYDMARKIAILSSLAYKSEIKDCDIKTYGIRNIKLIDINFLKKRNLCVKLLASSEIKNGAINAVVEPVLLPINSVLGQIDSNLNIVNLECDVLGEYKLIGQGAGKNPTANAVVSDVLDIINDIHDDFEIILNQEVALTNDNVNFKSYYFRSTFDNKSDLDKALKFLDNFAKDIEIKNDNIFIITNEIDIATKEDLFEKLEIQSKEVFYARM